MYTHHELPGNENNLDGLLGLDELHGDAVSAACKTRPAVTSGDANNIEEVVQFLHGVEELAAVSHEAILCLGVASRQIGPLLVQVEEFNCFLEPLEVVQASASICSGQQQTTSKIVTAPHDATTPPSDRRQNSGFVPPADTQPLRDRKPGRGQTSLDGQRFRRKSQKSLTDTHLETRFNANINNL